MHDAPSTDSQLLETVLTATESAALSSTHSDNILDAAIRVRDMLITAELEHGIEGLSEAADLYATLFAAKQVDNVAKALYTENNFSGARLAQKFADFIRSDQEV